MRLESKSQIESLQGAERERALIALHHAESATLERVGVTRPEVDGWVADAGITPPELTTAGEPLSLDDARAIARAAIDSTAGEVRSMYITVIPGQEGTYLEKRSDAARFRDAGYPEADIANYPWVEAKAEAMGGVTGEAAATEILDTSDQWSSLPGAIGPAIEMERERGNRLVTEAQDIATVDTERDAAIAALDALRPGG